jgi:hypothetical protein
LSFILQSIRLDLKDAVQAFCRGRIGEEGFILIKRKEKKE